jgi:hypothetical protein
MLLLLRPSLESRTTLRRSQRRAAAEPMLCAIALAFAAVAAASLPPTDRRQQQQQLSRLSRQTQEWWRWVLVRIYDSSTFIADGDDDARRVRRVSVPGLR